MGVPFISALCGNGLTAPGCGRRRRVARSTREQEQAAAYVADAYARLTGKLGVCAVSSGVAHVNALAGVTNAWYDGAPVLLLSGASAAPGLGRGAFQDMDQVGLAAPVTKYAERVTQASRIPLAFREAVGAACGGRPGPAHLTISLDALQGSLPPDAVDRIEPLPCGSHPGPPRTLTGSPTRSRCWPTPANRSSSPAVACSTGRGRALRRFARQTATPVVVPIWDRSVIDTNWDTYMGVVGAASGEPDILTQADLILLLGAAVDYRVRYLDAPPLRPGVKVLRVTADARQMYQGVTPDVCILGDAHTVLDAWHDMWSAGELAPHTGWLDEARAVTGLYRRWTGESGASLSARRRRHERRGPGASCRGLARLDPEPVLLIDGGNIGQWAHMQLASQRYPAHWLTCGRAAWWAGRPGAMAARLAYPDRPVVLPRATAHWDSV